ncbi:PDZ domain-containing protein [Micromonospora sp. NPDC049799]|uniref:PDZ domain-containing protein n=1 Tax=Micromonospora sp. NPDC049799 TaxID=3154741 RepID=UPI0033EB8E95
MGVDPVAFPGHGHRSDGTETRFRVVGADPLSDLAVLRVEGATVPAVELGDVILSAGGRPVSDGQGLQRLMLGDAIGARLPVTVLRKGALVDAVAVPTELSR